MLEQLLTQCHWLSTESFDMNVLLLTVPTIVHQVSHRSQWNSNKNFQLKAAQQYRSKVRSFARSLGTVAPKWAMSVLAEWAHIPFTPSPSVLTSSRHFRRLSKASRMSSIPRQIVNNIYQWQRHSWKYFFELHWSGGGSGFGQSFPLRPRQILHSLTRCTVMLLSVLAMLITLTDAER